MRARAQVEFVLGSLRVVGSWLDIGAGHGLLLDEARRQQVARTGALEPDLRCGRQIQEAGHHLYASLFETRTFWDVVSFSHVLEHLTRPRQFLKDIQRLLTQQGHVFCEVPNEEHLSESPLDLPPSYLAASFILEEGFALSDLKRIVDSMAQSAMAAGVPIVTGDTKVVERGSADGVFITTTGIGTIAEGINISGENARPGDKILVSGLLGDHGIAVMALRENLSFQTSIQSDTAALHDLVANMVAAVPTIHVLRDATRGGVATVLNEIAKQSAVGMMLYESKLPMRAQVNAACEFLGLDPLYIANEGKLIAICGADDAENLLNAMP